MWAEMGANEIVRLGDLLDRAAQFPRKMVIAVGAERLQMLVHQLLDQWRNLDPVFPQEPDLKQKAFPQITGGDAWRSQFLDRVQNRFDLILRTSRAGGDLAHLG